jgi:hypothetical protein
MSLLNWVWGWFRKPTRAGVFRFALDGVPREIDPLRTWFALRDDPAFEWDRDPWEADQGDPEALRRTIAAARKALGFKPFAEGGPADSEAVRVLAEFTAWVLSQKKTRERSPITSPTLDPSLGHSMLPSESDSASGSTAYEPAVPQFID